MSQPLEYGTPIQLHQAIAVAKAAAEEAQKNGWNMAIAVVDSGGNLVLAHRMDQTQLGSMEVAERKAAAANNFKRPTKMMDEAVTKGGAGMRLLVIPGVLPIEGGELLIKDGKIIGAIGVSGSLSANDVQTALAGVAAL
ncbi:MAG TPA: heme-binding protein [Leptospiraceae bacterium]|nr:heme-binding protein [Leptospirales bacterium]HMU85376.1 heme-binding protein [Leptospiraceae bacterium]HMX57834.1 heme-binding protein [Leptospiraceae bacterium]HMY47650.1 heme-binding protein [Leptospiraceae bacterium]HNN57325.1 heme-binding protein [Leptospiraceae bacterium]